MNGMHELRYQLQVNDKSALWDFALAKAMSYPDTTVDTVVEMIGPREDMDVVDCLLLLSQLSIAGCEILTIRHKFIPEVNLQ